MLALFIILAALAAVLWIGVGWAAACGWNAHRWARDSEDSRRAWQDVREAHQELIDQRAEMFAIFEELSSAVEVPGEVATSPAPYPGTSWPCMIHGAHQTGEACAPPDDTDWLASSGLQAYTQSQLLIEDFRRQLQLWDLQAQATAPPQIEYPTEVHHA